MLNRFEVASLKERLAFDTLVKNYNLFNNNYKVNSTAYDGNDVYDYYIHKYNDNFSIIKRIFVEIKIRILSGSALEDARSNGWILESKKFNDLKRIAQIDPEASIIYVNFTPDGVYFYDLLKLEKEGSLKLTKKVMNRATMCSKIDKTNKGCYLLKSELAFKHYPFVWSDLIYDNNQKEILNKRQAEKLNMIIKDDMTSLSKAFKIFDK